MTDKTREKIENDRAFLSDKVKYIAGVDEVGRGPLAGPVTVCAVIMDLDKLVDGVNDSKKLTAKKREALYDKIIASAIDYKIVSLDNDVIDRINILAATKEAMKQAVCGLKVKPDVVLVDAVKLEIPYSVHSIIHGDALSYSIGAASILAKVYRDRLMDDYDKIFPEYGFSSNKGYGSAKHIAALKEFGPTPIHRKTFIKNFCPEE